MRIYFALIFLILSASCEFILFSRPLYKIKKHIKENYNVNPCGISEQGMEGKYEQFGIMFDHHNPMEKKEAIAFVNAIYTDLIEKVNQYPSLQNEFVDQPVSKKRLFVKVFFSDETYTEYFFPLVCVCKAYEKNFEIDFKRLRYGKKDYISEEIYYEYD